jgi:hypothetical protein
MQAYLLQRIKQGLPHQQKAISFGRIQKYIQIL